MRDKAVVSVTAKARGVQTSPTGWVVSGGLILAVAGWAVQAPAQETIVTSHGISTFGELKYPADMAHLDYVNPDAPKGGEMSQWAFGGFDSMNPYSEKGRPAVLSSAMYESILTGTADEIGAVYCLLCETMEYPEDRSWVIFNLRPEAAFSDGSPLTAEDVIFSFETFLTKGLTDFRTVFGQQVEGAEILGPHRVKFTFKPGVPYRDLPADVGGLPILSKADYEANNRDLSASSMEPFLGSGAYVLDRLNVGQTVVYRRNPDYWGNDLPFNRGTNNFDTIRYEYFADYTAAFEGFKAGSYAFRNEASSLVWATGYDFPALQSGDVLKVELPSGAKASGQAFLFNLRREKFQDSRVREAIGLMLNFEWGNATLAYGIFTRINSIWDNSDLAATGVPTAEEAAILQPLVDEGLLAASILTDEAVMAPVSGERQLDRANLRKASALLDEAGWDVIGGDGLRRNAAGDLLRLEFLNDSPSFDRWILPYIENLRALGVDAYMTSVDNAQMKSREGPPTYDFDLVIGNALGAYIPGSELEQYYGSATADVSLFNKMGLKNPAVDRLIEVVKAADSNESMMAAVKALDRVLRAERFWVPQWNKNTHTIAYYNQYEHPENLPPFSLGDLSIWWYDAEKGAGLKASGALR